MSDSTINVTHNMYEDKINKIKNGIWTITCDQFSVKINMDQFSRTLNQNELRALKTQIKLSITTKAFKKIKKLISKSIYLKDFTESVKSQIKNNKIQFYLYEDHHEDINLDSQLEFLYHFYKMRRYKKIIQYLNDQGIDKFKEIREKTFDGIEDKLYLFNMKIIDNQPSFTFSLQKFQNTTFRNIGNYLLELKYDNKDAIFVKILPYLNAISGQINSSNIFHQKVKEYLSAKLNFDIFDSAKLGYNFCNYILKLPNVQFETITNQKESLNLNNIIDTIPDLKKSIQNAFYSKNLLFFKVCRPSHCYHCIKSLPKLLTLNKRKCYIYFNEKSLIFCKNGGNFAEQIQEIPKSSVKDSESSNSSSVYFIIHPETLNDEDYSLLEEFIGTRISYVNDTDLPKVIIISTFDFKSSFSFYSDEFSEIRFNINDTNEIEAFYNLSLDQEHELLFSDYSYYLYKSEVPGAGKTYQIHEKMKEIQTNQNIKEKPLPLFIDSNMKYLPYIKPGIEICHFDLSPELFDEKFGFFDDLWIFCNLHYHLLSNGENIRTPKYLFFEAPTLTPNQHSEGGSIRAVDFPIAVHNVVDVKSSDTKIVLSNEIKNLCEKVFQPINGRNIIYTADLLKISLKMFYPNIFSDSNAPNFDLRFINETNLFLNYFCKYLNLDTDENLKLSQAIFILLLRTNFHIWTTESIFKTTKQPKSFIIIANQSLFHNSSINDVDNSYKKWNLLCFVSKDEKDKTKWETKYLIKDISDHIKNISDSSLFDNTFFNILEHNNNIDVYTNLGQFPDNQLVFTKIISSFFLNDTDNNSIYTNIIDTSIISMYHDLFKTNDQVSRAVTNSLLGISPTNSEYIKNHPEGLQSMKIVIDILKKRISESTELDNFFDELIDKKKRVEEEAGKKYPIESMIFTITLVKRFVIMIIRIILRQPLILEGFTGVGKTAVLHLLNTLFDLVGDRLGWRFYQIDCHGDLLFDNIQKDVIEKKLDFADRKGCTNHIFFFDELNTSPGSCCVINYMNNYGMVQKLKDNKHSITFIAAINPYIKVDKVTRDLSRVGIKQFIPTKLCKLRLCSIAPKERNKYYETPDLNKLAYNVRELSESTKLIVLKSDPELFLLTDDETVVNDEVILFLPPDERAVIKNMVLQYYNLIREIIPKDEDYYPEVKQSIKKYRKCTIEIIYNLICQSFLCIRGLMILRSILSYRDVKRFMMHFINFFRKDIKYYIKEAKPKNLIDEYIRNKVIPDSIIYSLMLSIVFRFSGHTKLDKKEKNEILNRCNKINFELIIEESKEEDYIILNICSSLLNKLNKIEWNEEITKPKGNNWIIKIIDDFSTKIFDKYATNKEGIFKVKSLVIHLFALTSCFSVSRHFPEEPIMPCLIIGMPGTSKTLAIQLFIQHKKVKNNFYSTTYLSTRASEADGLNAHYRDCAMFMIEREKNYNDNPMAICVIDELGLANLNETRPLKLLHYYFDKGIAIKDSNDENSKIVHVMSIAASNYALDFANMNRGILICTDLPSDEDISISFDEKDPNQVKNFLSILWNLTENKKRPEMLALRPLYLLYNVLFVHFVKKFSDVCVYLTSVISCHPNKTVEKATELIEKLGLKDKINYTKKNSNIMCDIISNFITQEFFTRALCVRTKNYDCLDYIENLISKIGEKDNMSCVFHHIYPTDFKLPSHICADHALKQIFDLMTDQKVNERDNEKHVFLIIGNASFSDSLLDLLNAPNQHKCNIDTGDDSSLLSQNGFSIRINYHPTSIMFAFIMNDEDFERKNSVDSFPLPLLDRFDQTYFDYNTKDPYKVIQNSSKIRKKYLKNMIPDCQQIHDYFKHFVDSLSEVKKPDDSNVFPMTIIEKPEGNSYPQKFIGNVDEDELFKINLYSRKPNLNKPKNRPIIGIFRRKQNEDDWRMMECIEDNMNNLKPTIDTTYIEYNSRNSFYQLEDDEESHPIRDRIFDFNIESYNNSIVGLKDYINNQNHNKDPIKAIIFTISPMMEPLKDINEDNSIILYDQYIQSSKYFEDKIYDDLIDTTKYIIIQSNQFSTGSQSKAFVHDRHLRHLLTTSVPNILKELKVERDDLNLIIIYHLKDSILPEGINPSEEWPMFWIESISDSPLDKNDSNLITNCILFRKEYKENYSNLTKNMLDQLYLDLWTNFNIMIPNSTENQTKKSKKKQKQKQKQKTYPKLKLNKKQSIFKEIIRNEKRIANDKENNEDDDFDDSVFRSFFELLKNDESYLKNDLKRLFYEKLKSYLPSYLSFFVKLLISNTDRINEDDENYLQFIKNLYRSKFVQSHFSHYLTNQFQPFQVDKESPYFPELILEQVLILYDRKHTSSLSEVFEYINQYIELHPVKSDIVTSYINHYFVPYITKTSHNEKDKDKINSNENDFYKAFESLLLLRGELDSQIIHNHLSLFERKLESEFSFQIFLTFKFTDEKPLINDDMYRVLMKNDRNKLIDLFFKHQLLMDVADPSTNSTSIKEEELNLSNSVELTQMIVLSRPFMDNDAPLIDFIKKNNNEADEYIFKCKPFINMIYFEKLIQFLKGDRKSQFTINHDDSFFNYHHVFPEDAFNIIDIQTDDIPESDLVIIGENSEISAQLFKENSIFQKTYDLIKSIEFPSFKTSSKTYDYGSYIDLIYPHEMIRKEILHKKSDFIENSSFSEWLFDTDAPLFVRQLFSTFNSIKAKNDEEIIHDLTVFSLLLNPWSKDPSAIILFWNYVNENINNFIPKEEDKNDNFSSIALNIQKAFERNKWYYPLIEGKIYYIFDKKCIQPKFFYEINYQIDHLMFSIAISSKSCSTFSQYCNMFKSLPYLHLIRDIPIILAFSEYLQKKFIFELDTLFVILNTLNCEELTNIGTEMKGISLYSEIQNCIENNVFLLEKNKDILKQNEIKNTLIKINKTVPNKSAYEQINFYTHKVTQFYNNVLKVFYNNSKRTKFNQIQLKNLYSNFDIKDIIVLSSFLITHDNGRETNCTLDIKTFLSKAFSNKAKFNNHAKIDLSSIYPKNVILINYPEDYDFLGFTIGHFENSIFNNINMKEVMLNMEYFVQVEDDDDPLYKEKCFAMAIKCRPYNESDKGDAFDALAYLLVMLSKSKERVKDTNKWRYLFYDITNNNKSRVNQVFENLYSLISDVNFEKSRVHIKGQGIIKKVLKRIIPVEFQDSLKF